MICPKQGKIYVGDIGTEFILDSEEDLSAATIHDILFEKPDGTTGTWPGSVVDTTKIHYFTVDGDLDISGEWEVQIRVALPGWSGREEEVHCI